MTDEPIPPSYIPGELESFHRNCATNNTDITNSCETVKSKVLTRVICSCNWSYCNTAAGSLKASRTGVLSGLAVVVLVAAASSSLGRLQRPVTAV